MGHRDDLVRGEDVTRSPEAIDGVAEAATAEDESYGFTAITRVNVAS